MSRVTKLVALAAKVDPADIAFIVGIVLLWYGLSLVYAALPFIICGLILTATGVRIGSRRAS